MRKIVKIAGWLVVVAIAILSLVPGELRPHTGAPGPFEHVVAYAICAGLLTLGCDKRNQAFVIVLCLAAFAGTLEIVQIWVPGRHSDLVDFATSSGGAFTGSVLAWVALRSLNRIFA